MIKWIVQDIKRILSNKKTFLLLAMILVSIFNFTTTNIKARVPEVKADSIVLMARENDGLSSDPIVVSNIKTIAQAEYIFPFECSEQLIYGDLFGSPTISENLCDDFNIYLKYLNQLFDEKDLEVFYEIKLVLLNSLIDDFLVYFENTDGNLRQSILEKSINIDQVIAINNFVNNNLKEKYPDINFSDNDPSVSIFNQRAIDLIETFINYENNYPLNVKYVLTGSFFLVNYLNDNFIFLIILTIVLIFDSFYRDYSSGVVKPILSSPINRYKYVVVKTISSIISILIFISIPLLLTYIALLLYNGFDSTAYPMYISQNTFTHFNPIVKYTKILGDNSPLFNSTYKNICSILPVAKFPVDVPNASYQLIINCERYFNAITLEIIPINLYLAIVIGYFILIIIFISSLNTLISLLFEKSLINISILGSFVFISSFLNKIFIGSNILKLLPSTFLSPTALLMGTVPYTFINGLITVGIWTILISFLNYYLITHKDFTY